MLQRAINASDAPAADGGYSQAMEISGFSRLLTVSGQVPVGLDGGVPDGFAEQCRLAWRNVEAQLAAAGMSLDNVVKVTTYLADRADAAENGAIRRSVLGDRAPALTVVLAGIFDPAWLLEVEVLAAA
jgi:2-iminobutanoate/2-iminopropanoate deaminase